MEQQLEQGAGGETPTLPGTVVQPIAGKRANWTIAHKVEGEVITWQVKGAGTLTLDLLKMSQANRLRAIAHGMVQRISDAAAMARDSKTGASATPAEKFAAMQRLCEHYQSGSEDWSPARGPGVSGPRRDLNRELLVMALSVHAPEKELGVLEEFVKRLTKEQVAGLLVSKELKVAVETAREALDEQEREATKGVDAQELLQGL